MPFAVSLARRTCWLFIGHQKTPIEGGMLLLEQFAFRFSERLVNEMTSSTIEEDCLVEIVSDNAKRD
jgi:hypothetical protein